MSLKTWIHKHHRLITAAPELQGALRHAIAGNVGSGVTCPYCGSREAFCWLREARAALSKVDGVPQ